MNDEQGPDSTSGGPDEPTQPVSGVEPVPPAPVAPVWGGGAPPPPAGPPDAHEYAQQPLLPQEVHQSRSRTGLYIAIAAAVVLVLVAVAVLLVVSRGGDDREAYCNKLRDVTHNGDLGAAFQEGQTSDLQDLADLAPSSVSDDWNTLITLINKASDSGEPGMTDIVAALSSVRAIASDAQSECDITIDLPSFAQ
jgi:hypothetical protein